MQNQPNRSIRHMLAGLVAASLVACAAPAADPGHARHHPGQTGNATPPASSATSGAQGGAMGSGMMGGGMAGGTMMGSGGSCAMMGGDKTAGACGMQNMNKDQMCAMYRGMRDAPNEQARQAMMDHHMQGMSPQMRQQRMEIMRQQCQ